MKKKKRNLHTIPTILSTNCRVYTIFPFILKLFNLSIKKNWFFVIPEGLQKEKMGKL